MNSAGCCCSFIRRVTRERHRWSAGSRKLRRKQSLWKQRASSWQISEVLAILHQRADCSPRPRAVNWLGENVRDFRIADVVITLRHDVALTMMFLHAKALTDVINSSGNVSLQGGPRVIVAPDDEGSNSTLFTGTLQHFGGALDLMRQKHQTPPTELTYTK